MTTDMNTYRCKYCIQAVFNLPGSITTRPHNEPNSQIQDTSRKNVAHLCEARDWASQIPGIEFWGTFGIYSGVVEVMHPNPEESGVGVGGQLLVTTYSGDPCQHPGWAGANCHCDETRGNRRVMTKCVSPAGIPCTHTIGC